MQKLVEMARRSLDIDQKATDAARHDNPKTLSASLDVTESEICAHFIGLARGFGCAASRVDEPEGLLAELQQAALRSVPTVIEIDEGRFGHADIRELYESPDYPLKRQAMNGASAAAPATDA